MTNYVFNELFQVAPSLFHVAVSSNPLFQVTPSDPTMVATVEPIVNRYQ